MSRYCSARRRGAVAAIVLLAGALPGLSGEKSAPASTTVPRAAAPDALGETREDLQRLKAGRETLLSSPGSLPRLTAPEWHGAGAVPAAPPATPPRSKSDLDTRSPNWLIEAMRKPDRKIQAVRMRTGEGIATADGLPTDSLLGHESRSGEEINGRESSERNGNVRSRTAGETNSAVNPLVTFLDDWMSPQDLALLKPGLATTMAGQIASPVAALPFSAFPSSIPASVSGVGGSAPIGSLMSPDVGTGQVRENPFLQALNSPALSVPLVVPSRTATSSPLPSLVQPPDAPPSPLVSPPRIPEFPRATSDEKYFKPLKRF